MSAVIIVGSDKIGAHGAHGAEKHVPIYHFFYWHECDTFLRKMKGCKIYGIIDSLDAKRIQTVGVRDTTCSDGSSGCNRNEVRSVKDINKNDVNLDSSLAFIVTGGGRRYSGELTVAQEAICDELLTLHFPREEYASVIDYDVYVAIILERYSSAMGFDQRSFTGEKFFINDDGMKHMKVTKLSKAVDEYNKTNNATDENCGGSTGVGKAIGDADLSEDNRGKVEDVPSLNSLFLEVE